MKKCTGPCGRELDESEFYVKDKKSGRRFARCKTCHNKQSQADYHGPKHAERLEQRKQYGKKHRTERTAYVREWRKANPEKNREIGQRSDAVRKGDPVRRVKKRGYAATYRRKHADAIAAYNEAYRERNRMVLRLRYRMWCQANPDAYEAIRLRWRRANRATVNAATHRRRALLRGCAGTWTAEEWAALKEAQDHTCLACGLREPEILLTPDHVHPLAKGGDNTLLNLQGLCGSCNSQKGVGTTDLRDDALATFLADVLKYGIEAGDVVPPDARFDGDDEPDESVAAPVGSPAGAAVDDLPLSGNRKLWEHLDEAGRSRYADRVVQHYREAGYPHYRLDETQKREQVRQLLAYRERAVVADTPQGGVILTGGHGLGLCWGYHPHAAAVRCNNRRTPMETFDCDRWFHSAITRRLSRGDYLSDSGVRKALRTAPGVQAVSNFRPTAAMAIYGRFRRPGGLAVWDMSAGYGGRLLGAWASGDVRRYVGTDPCVPTYAGLNAMHDDLAGLKLLPEMMVDLHRVGSEAFEPAPGSLDLCFTSPPYFTTEDYGDEPGQSFRKFPKYADWLDGFLGATLRNCWSGLRPGGVLSLNVANVKSAPHLERDTVATAEKVGFRPVETLRLALAHLTAGGHKFEPVFVFARD